MNASWDMRDRRNVIASEAKQIQSRARGKNWIASSLRSSQ
jgi:hypothetical protein